MMRTKEGLVLTRSEAERSGLILSRKGGTAAQGGRGRNQRGRGLRGMVLGRFQKFINWRTAQL